MYRKQALRLLALVDGAIKTIPQSKQSLRHRGAGRSNCRRQRKWLGIEREKKKRGSLDGRGKEESFICFQKSVSHFALLFSKPSSAPPPSCFPLLPSSAWALRLGSGKRRHGIFPQFYGSRPNPTPTHFLSPPSAPSAPCQEGVLRKTIHTPVRILHVCGCVCCAKQNVAMVTNNRKKKNL